MAKKTQINLSPPPEIAELFRKMALYRRASVIDYFIRLVENDAGTPLYCSSCGEILAIEQEENYTGKATQFTCPVCRKINKFDLE